MQGAISLNGFKIFQSLAFSSLSMVYLGMDFFDCIWGLHSLLNLKVYVFCPVTASFTIVSLGIF